MALYYTEHGNHFMELRWWLHVSLSVLDAWIQPDPTYLFLNCTDEEDVQLATIYANSRFCVLEAFT